MERRKGGIHGGCPLATCPLVSWTQTSTESEYFGLCVVLSLSPEDTFKTTLPKDTGHVDAVPEVPVCST